MSKYTKEEQLEIVREAMNLQTAINSEKTEINIIENQKFRQKPQEPIKETANKVSVNYPAPPKTKYSFEDHIANDTTFLGKMFTKKGLIISGVICVLTFFFAFPVFAVCFVIKYFEYINKRNEFNKQLANTPEYLQARAEAEKVASEEEARVQQQLDEKYSLELKKYNAELKKYNEDFEEWERKRLIKLNILKEDLASNKEALSNLYDSTLLIPKNNRTVDQLVWIYDDMSTSEHDFERALDQLGKENFQEAMDRIKDQVESLSDTTSQGFMATLEAIDYGNYELDEIRGTLGKVRRDMNIANVGATVQRRNLRKEVKTTNIKLDDLSK